MAPVRSRRLWGPLTVAAGASVVVYTVPVDRTAIVRSMRHSATSGVGSAILQVSVTADGTGGVILAGETLNTPETHVDSNWWAIDEGDSVSVGNAGTVPLVSWGFGSLLLGDPS